MSPPWNKFVTNRCRAAEEISAFESQQDRWEMKREIWEGAVRELVADVDDATLDKYSVQGISPDDAAFPIASEACTHSFPVN